jgi:hypothetical protein
MARATKKDSGSTKKDTKSEDHWSNRMSKASDKSKRIPKMEIDPAHIVNGTRKRKEINYRDLQLGRELKKVKRDSANVLEKRQSKPTKIQKTRKTTTAKQAAAKKDAKK